MTLPPLTETIVLIDCEGAYCGDDCCGLKVHVRFCSNYERVLDQDKTGSLRCFACVDNVRILKELRNDKI